MWAFILFCLSLGHFIYFMEIKFMIAIDNKSSI